MRLAMRNSIWSSPGYYEEFDENSTEPKKWFPSPPMISRQNADIIMLLSTMLHEIPGNTLKKKFEFCVNCNCCPRHQVNKPTSLNPWIELPSNNANLARTCDCDCRHKARWICRQVPNIPQKEDEM